MPREKKHSAEEWIRFGVEHGFIERHDENDDDSPVRMTPLGKEFRMFLNFLNAVSDKPDDISDMALVLALLVE